MSTKADTPWDDQAKELLGLLAQDEAYLQDLQRAKEAQKPYRRGSPLRGSASTSALARGPSAFASFSSKFAISRTSHSSSRKISPGRVKPSKPWVDYVPPPVPVPAKEIRAPSLDQMERDLREWTIKKDAIQQAMHEGAKQEYARAAATIEQLGQQEVEQRERCKRALSELKRMQLELFEANRKIEILEGSNAALRKRAAEAEAARDSLQGERKKLHNELPKVTKDATERADFLEKKLAEAEATRIEQVQRQILRRIMHRDLGAHFLVWAADVQAKRQAKRDEARDANAQASIGHMRNQMEALKEEHKKELAELKEELESHRLEAELKVEELLAAAEKDLADRAMKEEEERRELFMRQAIRRLTNRDLSAGFNAWVEMCEAKAYAMKTLRQIANRLHPKNRELASAFYFWADDCSERGIQAQLELHERRARKMMMTLEIRDKEIKRLKTMLNVLQPETKEQAALREKREAQIKAMKKRQAAAAKAKK